MGAEFTTVCTRLVYMVLLWVDTMMDLEEGADRLIVHVFPQPKGF